MRALASFLTAACVCLAASQEVTAPPSAILFESFQTSPKAGVLGHSFVRSSMPAYENQPVSVAPASSHAGVDGDLGLLLKDPARHYAVTAAFEGGPISTEEGLVVQYEVRLQEGLTCGGAYIKLLNATEDFDASKTDAQTPYVIMFGPDRCGGGTDKVHFIVRFKNPVTGVVEEKHLVKAPRTKPDTLSHLYTLVIRPDNTFAVKVDNVVEHEGRLDGEGEFKPSITEAPLIDDASDVKPADWVDAAKIADPTAAKPDDWDESAPEIIEDTEAVKPASWLDDEADYIPDPNAMQPEGWDEEEDGEYTPPLIKNPACESGAGCGVWKRPTKRNPAYKGKWSPPLIDNPEYKGVWAPRQIPNPGYFEDEALYRLSGARMAGVGVEVWTMTGGILMDNFLVARSETEASELAERTWRVKFNAQNAAITTESRSAAKQARLAAYEAGGFMDKIGYYLSEAWDVVVDNTVAAAVTGAVILISLLVAFWMCCLAGEEFAPERASTRGGAAGGDHAHVGGGELQAGESDEDEVDPRLEVQRGARRQPAAAAAAEQEEEPAPAPAAAAVPTADGEDGEVVEEEEEEEAPKSGSGGAPRRRRRAE